MTIKINLKPVVVMVLSEGYMENTGDEKKIVIVTSAHDILLQSISCCSRKNVGSMTSLNHSRSVSSLENPIKRIRITDNPERKGFERMTAAVAAMTLGV
jgi:hypothetical protein